MTDRSPAQFLDLASTDQWSELQSLMVEMGSAAPYWRVQSTDGVLDPPDDGWYADWDHQFRLEGYKYIQWCELYPRLDDESLTLDDVRQVCEAIRLEIEVEVDRVRIQATAG